MRSPHARTSGLRENRKGSRISCRGLKINPNYGNHKIAGKNHFNYGKHVFVGADNPMYGVHRYGASAPNYGKKHTPEAKEEMRKRAIENLKKGLHLVSPNVPEKQINDYLQKFCCGEYKYTGDGSFWTEGMNPDFVNINGQKKTIEHFGCYWHACPKCFPNRKIREGGVAGYRIAKYKEHGWDCLVVWEHEMKNENYKKLIDSFVGR